LVQSMPETSKSMRRLVASSWPAALIGIAIIKTVLSLAVKPGPFVVSYSAISYLLLLLLGICFVIRNGIQDTLGGRLFWALLAVAYGLWGAHQGLTLYYELVLRVEVPDNSIADSLLFLHVAVLLAAVATLPHHKEPDRKPYTAGLNALLVLLLSVFVYAYVVFPYQYLFPSDAHFSYALRFDLLYLLENLALILAVGMLTLRVEAAWKSTYLHLLGASTLYALSSSVANLSIDSGGYVNGKLYGLGLTASVCWFVWLPLGARRAPRPETKAAAFDGRQESQASVWAMLVVVMISFPIFWELFERNENAGLRTLRVALAIAMIVCLASTAYIKEYLAKRELASHFGLARDRLRMAMESGKTVGWDWDVKSGRDTWFGDLETMFGIPGDTYTGCVEDFRRRVHPQDRGRVWNAVNEAMKNGTPYSAEFRVLRRDGTIRWIAAKGQSYFRHTGEPTRMLGMAIDITELKQAQQALQASEERLRLGQWAAHIGTFDLNLRTGMDIWTPETEALYGLPPGGFGGTLTAFENLIHPDDRDRIKELTREMMRTGRPTEAEWRVVWPDGSVHWIASRGQVLMDESGEPSRMLGVNIDITERKQAEQVLSGMTRKLVEAQEQERVRIARELHDDINQRLALVAIGLDQLREKHKDLPAEVRGYLQELQQMTSDTSSSVYALSHELYSSIPDSLGLAKGMKSWCKTFGDRQELQIDFKSQDVRKAPQEISLCLFRVLQEAVHNAAKHSGAERIDVQLAENAGEIRLIVSDSGKGFDIESARRSPGLGLTSMQERVRLIGGTIVIDSKPSAGTTIHVSVPFTEEPRAQAATG